MKVGVPKEVKNHEYRVAITPIGVHELTAHGHEVFVEKGAGVGSQIDDAEFVGAGAKILDGPDGARRHEVGHVVLAGGIPPKGSVEAIKAFGAKVVVFAHTLALAKKLLRSGGDALVIEGSEAGGHIGPVSTSVLASASASSQSDAAGGASRSRPSSAT